METTEVPPTHMVLWLCDFFLHNSTSSVISTTVMALVFLLFPFRMTAPPQSCSPYSSGVPGQRSTTASPRCPKSREPTANHTDHLISVSCFHKFLVKKTANPHRTVRYFSLWCLLSGISIPYADAVVPANCGC